MAQARADCLGLLGALDPARIALDLAPPPSLARGTHDLLVRQLWLASSEVQTKSMDVNKWSLCLIVWLYTCSCLCCRAAVKSCSVPALFFLALPPDGGHANSNSGLLVEDGSLGLCGVPCCAGYEQQPLARLRESQGRV